MIDTKEAALVSKSFFLAGVAALFLATGSNAQERYPVRTIATISGPARVRDGDTVIVSGTVVRLKGVDAAELGTARGENAKRVMIALVTGTLTCRVTGEKTWGREVGYCVTTDGIDINQAIIASGAALACPRYDDRYMRYERADALVAQARAPYCEKSAHDNHHP
jgi:endonuclease YncB( thermonuclease family)